MFSDTPRNVLLLLSPTSTNYLHPARMIDHARNFREAGAKRVDLAIDPRTRHPLSRHMIGYPVLDFDRVATQISNDILRPLVGNSNFCDLSTEIREGADLKSLTAASRLATAKTSPHAPTIGMIFYAALHALTPERAPYERLVIPDLPPCILTTLTGVFGFTNRTLRDDDMGTSIDLSVVRVVLSSFKSKSPAVASGASLKSIALMPSKVSLQ